MAVQKLWQILTIISLLLKWQLLSNFNLSASVMIHKAQHICENPPLANKYYVLVKN